MKQKFDFLIIGGGVAGLSVAYELTNRVKNSNIAILEKECEVGLHASGRNSGVLHSGIYYPENTLKSETCVEGNRLIREFCTENGIPFNLCGKLIVASGPNDLSTIETLQSRALKNGVIAERVSEKEAIEIQPGVRTYEKALWCPDSGYVDVALLIQSLKNKLLSSGVTFLLSSPIVSVNTKEKFVRSGQKNIYYGYLFNCGGLGALDIAKKCDHGHEYGQLPFKGYYLFSKSENFNDHPLRVHIYPAPNLNLPFLGVHFTVGAGGGLIKIGPSANLAISYERYSAHDPIKYSEFLDIATTSISALLCNKNRLISLYWNEIRHKRTSSLLKAAARLYVDNAVFNKNIWSRYRPGIRAQLVSRRDGCFVSDFIITRGSNESHLLNYVSPGLTASFSMAKKLTNFL